MRYYFGVCVLISSINICFSQGLNKIDSLKLLEIQDGRNIINPSVIKEINNLFEPEVDIPSNSEFLFDITLPKTDFKKQYPLIYPNFRLENKLPDINSRNFTGSFLFEKKTSNFSFSEYYIKQINSSSLHINSEFNYKLNNRWSLELFRNHNSSGHNNPLHPNSIYRDQFGGGISYKITNKIKLKASYQYVYNAATKRWEWVLCSGINYDF